MKRWSSSVSGLVSIVVLFGPVAIAKADILYDQNVTGGVNYGVGNLNGGFTVFQDAGQGLELGLRAHTRYPSANDTAAGIMSHGNGTYGNFVAQGFFSNGLPGGPRGSWNFDFSINSNFNGAGGNLSNLTYQLKIDFDPSGAVNFLTLNPITSIGDNAPLGSSTLAQNSENLAFFAGPQPFNPNVSGIYDVVLQAFQGNTLVGQTSVQVLVGNVVNPEPASIALWSVLGLGGALYRWRRGRWC